jgi:molybdopterin synthase sulfur carrier subunit
MSKVQVKMFASLREAAGAPAYEGDAHDLKDLLVQLKSEFGEPLARLLDAAESDPERIVILVNGKNVGNADRRKFTLSEGDEVSLFPPVSGG